MHERTFGVSGGAHALRFGALISKRLLRSRFQVDKGFTNVMDRLTTALARTFLKQLVLMP